MRLTFDDFELDSDRRTLSRSGVPLHVSPKGFELLDMLLRERPRAIPKQELQERIWGDVIVEEANLTNLVSELRGILGDNPRHPRYIRTVHGFGYGFIGEVRTAEDPSPIPRGRSRVRGGITAVVGALVILVAIVYLSSRKADSSSVDAMGSIIGLPVRVEPIPTAETLAWVAASPDGRFLAYSTQATARKTIRLLHLESGSEVELLPMEEVGRLQRLRFSPDGDFIYYLAGPFADLGGHQIRRVSVLGGPSEQVIPPRDTVKIQGFALNPDGNRIAFGAADTETNYVRIVIADLQGNVIRELVEVTPSRLLCCTIDWSPDGRTLVTFVDYWNDPRSKFNLMTIDVENGETKLVAPRSDARLFSMSWLPKGDRLIATTVEGDLVYVSLPSGEVTTIEEVSGRHHMWAFPSGERLVSMTRQAVADLWTVDLETGTNNRISHVGRNQDGVMGLAWAPDGTIVFSSGREGDTFSLWACDADGSHRRQLTRAQDRMWHWNPVISPDGKWIVFVETRFTSEGDPSSRLIRIGAAGDGWTALTPPGDDGMRPAFTPDGASIVYTRRVAGNEPRAMMISIEGGAPIELPFTRECATGDVDTTGSMVVCCDRQSREYVLTFDGSLVWEGDVPANPPIHFTRSNTMSYPERAREGIGNVWLKGLDDSPPRQVTHFSAERVINHAWSPTEDRLVVSRGELHYEAVFVSNLPNF